MRHHVPQGSGRILVWVLVWCSLIGVGCSGGGGGGVLQDTVELHYDGDNLGAPKLAAATYEAAARFTPTQTGPLAGDLLTEIQFYLASAPANCRVKVYGAGSAAAPGAELYSADLTAGIMPDQWNSHVLQGPVVVPNGDLWIAIEFTNTVPQPTLGCDSGPLVSGADWLFASTDGSWISLQQRVGASVNWNIRGIVAL